MNHTTNYDRCETPEVLVSDRTLSSAQKLARLEAWEEDLKAWLRASDDSMTRVEPGPSGALLQRVVSCLAQLRSVEKPDGGTHGVSPTRNSPIPVRRVARALDRQIIEERLMNPAATAQSGIAPVDEDLADQARPGHGIPSQDPNPAAQYSQQPQDQKREVESVLMGGGVVAGVATGAAIGVAVAGPVGVAVGAALGAVAGALGGAAAEAAVKPEESSGGNTTV